MSWFFEVIITMLTHLYATPSPHLESVERLPLGP